MQRNTLTIFTAVAKHKIWYFVENDTKYRVMCEACSKLVNICGDGLFADAAELKSDEK